LQRPRLSRRGEPLLGKTDEPFAANRQRPCTPEEFAPRIALLCSPDWDETGTLDDFPRDKVMSFAPLA